MSISRSFIFRQAVDSPPPQTSRSAHAGPPAFGPDAVGPAGAAPSVCTALKHGSDRGDGFRLGRFRTLSARSMCPTGITTVRTPSAVTRPAGGGRGEIEHHAVEPGDAKEDVPGAKVPSRPCRLLATSRTVFAWTVTVTFLDCPVSHRGF